ncbi:MAG TPA: electron transport complex subunit RsxA [Gammaproteobacteria bacterium]|nr:electron transport complex subunit RsxA [Gammaproteobacteria bacterium]HIF86735.1 electron transport complex subunit RsxA [Gammaproteobacteria bacterium]HIL63866.1 electron transport complex subunit RsxA [Porticoccaceae bacterium]
MTQIFSIIVAAALVNNMVLIQSLGVSSLFAYSNRLRNAIELALVSFLVIFLASAINLILYRGLLAPLGLQYLALLCFVGVSSILTLLVLHSLEKYFPLSMRRQRLAFYLIAGNSSIIGLSLLNTASARSVVDCLAYSFGAAMGFALVLLAFTALRQRLDGADVPAPFRGAAIQLISAGIAAMCFLGFAGLV